MTDARFRGGNVAPEGTLAAELEQRGIRPRTDPFRTTATPQAAEPTPPEPATPPRPTGDIDQGPIWHDSSRGAPPFRYASPEQVQAELNRLNTLARREGSTVSGVQPF